MLTSKDPTGNYIEMLKLVKAKGIKFKRNPPVKKLMNLFYKLYPEFKKLIKVSKPKRPKNIQELANYLNEKVPDSEKWFLGLFKHNNFPELDLKHNEVFENKYIPDFISHKYKFIIEIDGGYHNEPIQKAKDAIRTQYLNKKGYNVIRIKYLDFKSYNAALLVIWDIIEGKIKGIIKSKHTFKINTNRRKCKECGKLSRPHYILYYKEFPYYYCLYCFGKRLI